MKKFILLLASLIIAIASNATHIVGGDITVKYISGNSFEVKLLFYRDCSPGSAAFDNNVTLGVYDKVTNAQLSTFTLPKISSAVKPLGDACFTPSLCVEEGIYKANVTLANNTNGCYISWQRCCRNGVVNNIVNPLGAGMVFYAEIPNPALHNNSPVFGSYPKAYMCHGEVNLENFSATDVDGDQLVYSLITPLNGNSSQSSSTPSPSAGPYSNITWKSPYSLSNIMGGTPTLGINAQTGIVNATPNMLGVYVFAVRVEEYRNGVKIGEIRRDVQYQVIPCQNPNIPGSSPTLTCNNPTATITCGSSVPNVTYSWTGPGILSGSQTSSPTVNAPGYYTVVVTQPSGCTNTSHILVNENKTAPNLTTGAPFTLTCTATSGTINASSTTPGVTYNWSGAGIVSGSNTANPTINAANTYTVTVTNPANGCTSVGTVVTTLNNTLPNLTTNPPFTLTCTTTSGTLNANSTTSGVNYSWLGEGVVSGGNTAAPTVSAPNTYTVTVTNPTNGCTKTATVTVASNITLPNVTMGSALTLTCTNTNGTINASSTTPGATYNWNGSGIASGATSNAPTVNATGTYTVTVTNPANGCTKTGTLTVTNNLAVPNVIPSEVPLVLTCSSTSGSMNASSSTPGATFSWSGSGIVSNGNTPYPTVNATGTYTVTVTNPANGCTVSALVNVTSNTTPPTVSSASALTLTCSNTSGLISASSNVGNASYNWSGPGIVSGGTTASPAVNAPGTYTVIATNPVNGCTNTTTTVVSQNITLPSVTSGPSLTLTCANTNGTITASTSANDPGYSWAGAGIASGANSSTPNVNAPGTYTVTITNPINGCTNTATVNVSQNITQPSISTAAAPTLTCTTTNSTISASSPVSGATFFWNGAGIVSGANSSSPTINAAGTYTVTATDPGNGCTNTSTVNVLQNTSLPDVTSGLELTLNCANPSGMVSANSVTSGATYAWNGPSILVGGNTSTPTVNAPGTYTVTVTNPSNGCTNTAVVNAVLDNIQPNLTAGAPITLTCTSPSLNVSAASSTQNVNYNWVGTGIVSGGNTASPIVNTAGTYTVTITNPVNGCTNSATVNVSVDQIAPNATPGNALTLTCTNTSNTINVSSTTPNANYNWSGPGIVSGGNTSSPIVSVIGTYTVIVTDPNNGCTSVANVIVNNNLTIPVATSGANAILTCTSTSATISASSSTPGVSYSWAGQNILSGNNNSSAIVNSPGTYTVTITDPINGCTNTTTVLVGIDNSLPTVNTSADLTLTCLATSGTISASSPNTSVNYSWSGPGIVSGNTTQNPTVNTSGTYTVTVTDQNTGCTSIATINVINNIIAPNVSAGSPLTLNCVTTSDTINVSSTTPNVNYNWVGNGIIADGNTSSPVVNAAGTYTVTITNPVNGCTNTATILVNNNTLLPSVTPGALTILTCTTTQNNINATSSTPNAAYNWSGPGIVSNGNTSSPTINAPGTYTVTVTDPINGCTSSATVLVNNNIESPNVVAGTPLVLTCTSTSGIISASSNTNVSYAWVGPNIIANGNTSSPTVNASGTYTVTVTDPTNGCTSTATVLVSTDNSIPNVSAIANLTLTCVSTSDTVFANSTTSGVNYNWAGPGIVLNGQTSSPTVNAPGTYTVTVTNPITGCTNTTTVVVNTNYISPELNSTSPVVLNCVITSDTLNASSAVNGVSFNWSGPGIVSGTTTPNPIVNAPGVYFVTITDPINGCTSTDSVIVNNNIVAPNVIAGGTLTLTCTTTSSNITASSTTPNATYNWSGPNIVSGANTFNPLVNGTGTYVVTVTDPTNGCTKSDTVTVNDNLSIPNVIAGGNVTFTCLISSSYISAASTTPGVSYNWAGPGIVSFGNTPSPTVNAAGTYTVTVTDPNSGCTATATVTAVTAPAPVATVSANITINLGTNTTLNATGGVSYLWTPATGLSCTNCASPIASPNETTTYCVLVTDQYGCVDSACVKVDVHDPCPISLKDNEFPNVFSPNGDNDNDLFFIKDWNNECVIAFSIEIYNRWGMLMFKSNTDGGMVHWDGRTASGQEAPDGSYFYIIKMTKVKQEPKIFKGSVTLVR